METQSRPGASSEDRSVDPLFRVLAESSRDMVWAVDLSHRFLYVSPTVEDFLGWTPEEYLALDAQGTLAPESLSVARREYADLLAEVTAKTRGIKAWRKFEARHRRKDGSLVWGEVSFSVLFDESGRPYGFHGATRDLGERRLFERALFESEEKYRLLVELVPVGIFECDLEGRLLFVNEALYRLAGYRRAEVPELRIANFLAPGEWERVVTDMRKVATGEPLVPPVYRLRRQDGATPRIEVRSEPLFSDGRVKGLRGIILDVEDHLRLEAELLRANRLEAVGVLAGGLAHDFNNLLTSILGYIGLASLSIRDLPVSASPASGEASGVPSGVVDEALLLLGEAERAALRGRTLTQQLISLSKGEASARELADLGAIVREAAALNARASHCDLDLDVAEDLPPILADRAQIFQLVQNLIMNASEAMPHGGRISLRLSAAEAAEGGRTKAPPGSRPGAAGDRYDHRPWLRLEVADRGPGVPPELRERIFEPYFTTKSSGSGLGLAICFSVADNHGGSIGVTDAPGGGALFRVLLPALVTDIEADQDTDGTVKAREPGRGRVGLQGPGSSPSLLPRSLP